jgi:hypothetical protein
MLARTYVFCNSCNSEAPRWEACFLLPLAHRAARLDFHVRDVDPLGSDLIGTASLPVAAIPRERAAAARTRRAHRPQRVELAGCRCLLAPPPRAKLAGCRLPARAAAAPSGPAPPRAKLAGRRLPARAAAAPSGPAPPRVDLAGEEAGCSPEKRLQYFKLVFPIFHSSNFNISYLQFQQFEVKC